MFTIKNVCKKITVYYNSSCKKVKKKLLALFAVLQIGRLKAEFRLADFLLLLKVSLLKRGWSGFCNILVKCL